MKKTFKFITIWFVSFSFLFLGITPVAAAPTKLPTYDYVAMGDSVAAGVRAVYGQLPGWETSSDYGYTDLVAGWLDNLGLLGTFDETYAISGQTSADLLGVTESKTVSKSLKKIEIVTITIGGNDFLGPLYAFLSYCVQNGIDFDLTDPDFYADITDVLNGIILNGPSTGAALQQNLTEIIQNIYKANRKVQIYVMGYYNPIPDIIYDPTFNTLVNSYIEAAVNGADPDGSNVTYVQTITHITQLNSYSMGYLLDDTGFGVPDIHPTEVGYGVIANRFENAIAVDFGI